MLSHLCFFGNNLDNDKAHDYSLLKLKKDENLKIINKITNKLKYFEKKQKDELKSINTLESNHFKISEILSFKQNHKNKLNNIKELNKECLFEKKYICNNLKEYLRDSRTQILQDLSLYKNEQYKQYKALHKENQKRIYQRGKSEINEKKQKANFIKKEEQIGKIKKALFWSFKLQDLKKINNGKKNNFAQQVHQQEELIEQIKLKESKAIDHLSKTQQIKEKIEFKMNQTKKNNEILTELRKAPISNLHLSFDKRNTLKRAEKIKKIKGNRPKHVYNTQSLTTIDSFLNYDENINCNTLLN